MRLSTSPPPHASIFQRNGKEQGWVLHQPLPTQGLQATHVPYPQLSLGPQARESITAPVQPQTSFVSCIPALRTPSPSTTVSRAVRDGSHWARTASLKWKTHLPHHTHGVANVQQLSAARDGQTQDICIRKSCFVAGADQEGARTHCTCVWKDGSQWGC